METKYWFYLLKEVTNENGYSRSNNLENDVFIAENRELAKEYVSNLYPDLPFRKPKNAPVGTKYIYLAPSDLYWYERLYKELKITCDYCNKDKIIIGTKNIKTYQTMNFCSKECRDNKETEIRNLYIDKNDHLGIKDLQGNLVGYIYKITNKQTMNAYVGQTSNPPLFRWWQHLKVNKKFEQMNISELLFEVLEVVTFNETTDTLYSSGQDKLNKREAFYIRIFDCVEHGYNEIQPKELEENLITLSNVNL